MYTMYFDRANALVKQLEREDFGIEFPLAYSFGLRCICRCKKSSA